MMNATARKVLGFLGDQGHNESCFSGFHPQPLTLEGHQ